MTGSFYGAQDITTPDFKQLDVELKKYAPSVHKALITVGCLRGSEMTPKILAAFCIPLFNRWNRRNRFQNAVACLLAKSKASVEVSSYIHIRNKNIVHLICKNYGL